MKAFNIFEEVDVIRRLPLLASVAMMLVMMHAQIANAGMKGFLDYIFEMSGPGRFWGAGIADEFMCFGTVPDIRVTGSLISAPPPAEKASGALHFQPKCAFLDQTKPHTHFSASGSLMYTDRTPSAYSYDPLKKSLNERIYAMPALLTVDRTIPKLNYQNHNKLFRGLLVGVGAGGIRFSGQRFDPFWTYSFEIPRITLKLGSLFAKRGDFGSLSDNYYSLRKSDRFQLQLVTKIIGPVRSEDFGALPGQKSGVYFKEHLTFSVNF